MGESGRYHGVTGDPRMPFHATVLLLKLQIPRGYLNG